MIFVHPFQLRIFFNSKKCPSLIFFSIYSESSEDAFIKYGDFFLDIIQWAGSTECFFVFSENGISNIWRREHVPHLLIFLTFPGMVAPLHHFPVELFQCLTTLSVINFFLVFNLSNRKQTRWNDYYFKFVKWVSISGFSNMVVGGTHTQNRLGKASPTVPTCDDKPILFSEVKQAEGWCKEMKTAEHHRYSEDG